MKFSKNPDKNYIIGFVVVSMLILWMYIAVYVNVSGGARWFVSSLVLVAFLHIPMVQNLYHAYKGRERLHETSKLFIKIYAGVVVVFGLFFPNMTEWVWKSTGDAVTAFDDSFKPGATASSPQVRQKVKQAPVASLKETAVTLHLSPDGSFQKADTPPGARILEKIGFTCLPACISQVEHDGDQLCQAVGGFVTDRNGSKWYWGTYRNTKCLFTTIQGASGITRYKERFLNYPGSNVDFPRDLRYAIYSFGSSWGIVPREDTGFGYVEVKVTLTTS